MAWVVREGGRNGKWRGWKTKESQIEMMRRNGSVGRETLLRRIEAGLKRTTKEWEVDCEEEEK